MEEGSKYWWQSRTIWVQVVAFIFAIGSSFEWWPQAFEQADAIAIIMAAVTVLTIILRLRTQAPVEATNKVVALTQSGMTK